MTFVWLIAPIGYAAAPRGAADRSVAGAESESDREAASKSQLNSASAERTLASKPKDRAAHLQAARAHLAEGADNASKVDAAQAHAAAVLQDHPNDIEALLLAGHTSVLKNDAASAARYYRAATLSDPKSSKAFLGLGDALSRMGDETGSTQAFAKYRELMGMPALQSDTKKN
jgi:predicted Zn-dependent protease